MRDAGFMRLFALASAAWLGAGNASSAAPDVLPAPEPFRYCVTCHGVELQGNRLVDAPRLAGLPEWYLARQMQAFRAGWRGAHPDDVNGMEMRPQATVLDARAVDQAVAYAARMPVRGAPPVTVVGDPDRGAALYATCAACHGGHGEGNEALASPPLAGQSDWYLVTQLENFRNGVRGSAPDDTQGALMRASVAALTDPAASADVVAYIATLNPAAEDDRP